MRHALWRPERRAATPLDRHPPVDPPTKRPSLIVGGFIESHVRPAGRR